MFFEILYYREIFYSHQPSKALRYDLFVQHMANRENGSWKMFPRDVTNYSSASCDVMFVEFHEMTIKVKDAFISFVSLSLWC